MAKETPVAPNLATPRPRDLMRTDMGSHSARAGHERAIHPSNEQILETSTMCTRKFPTKKY